MKAGIIGLAMACLLVPVADAQSLQSIVKGLVKDTLTGTAGEFVAGADISETEEDQFKMYWDNPKYAPFILDGHHLFRTGNSGASKYRGGVRGWHNCDGAVLVSMLTKVPLSAGAKQKCTAQEHWIQQGSSKAGHEHPTGWPMWSEYVTKRERDFSQLPLHLYYRFDFMSLKEERPDGLILHFGTPMALLGFPGFGIDSSQYDITLKGPDVVYEWEKWIGSSPSSATRQRQDRGHVRVLLNLSKQQRDAVLRGNRNMAWDTIFYTVQSVRKVQPLRGDRPRFEVTLTVDKVVLGMDPGHNPPVNRLVF